MLIPCFFLCDQTICSQKNGEAGPRSLRKIYSVQFLHGTTTNWTRLGEKSSSTCHTDTRVAAWQETSFHCSQTYQARRLSGSCCTSGRINQHPFIRIHHTSQDCPAPAPVPNATECLLQTACVSPPCRLHLGSPGEACFCNRHRLIGNHLIL